MTRKYQISNIKYQILIGIILLAVFLRFYNLSGVPPSASLDEATIGWNAYSILKTGGDEYGNKFPLLLRAYDDWRPALYVYLVSPFVWIFDLNVLAVRLPSVILSVLTVVAVYFLVRQLLKNRPTSFWQARNEHVQNLSERWRFWSRLRQAQSPQNDEILALLTSFFLAISPWHIYISRLGHEANLGFSLGIFAILFFLKFTNSFKNIYIYLSSIFFALSFYAYQAEKIFIPLIVIILVVLLRKELLKNKKHVIIAGVLGLVILTPVLKETFSPEGLSRFRGTTAFDINQPVYIQAAKDRLIAKEEGDLLRELVNNNRIISLNIFMKNYISHFNPTFLFMNKSFDDFKAPGVGLLYMWELPFILIGLYFLISKKIEKRLKILLFGWIIISPVAASVTTGAPHAMRAYNLLPIPQILTGLGIFFIYDLLKNEAFKKTYIFFLILIAGGFGMFFFRQYFFEFPKGHSRSFQYALSQTIPYVLANENKYEKIIFSNEDNLYQSYMFFLFGSKHDPYLYQRQGGTVSGGFAESHFFGKHEFRTIEWEGESKDQNILYVGNPEDFPKNVNVIKAFDYLNGEIGVKIVE